MLARNYDNDQSVSIVFDCYRLLDIYQRMFASRQNFKQSAAYVKLVRSLSVQALPFIALGGINACFIKIPSTVAAGDVMDALLDGFVGVSNREINWTELREYCESIRTPLRPYEAVLDWLPSIVINDVFDFVRVAIENIDQKLIQPITANQRYEVIDVTMVDPKALRVKATVRPHFPDTSPKGRLLNVVCNY